MIKNCETCAHWRPDNSHGLGYRRKYWFFGQKEVTTWGRQWAKCARFQYFCKSAVAFENLCGHTLKEYQPVIEERN